MYIGKIKVNACKKIVVVLYLGRLSTEEVPTFAIIIKNFLNKMKTKKNNSGEMSFGAQVILFVLAVFIVWFFFSKNTTNEKVPYKTLDIRELTPDTPTAKY